MDLLKKIPAATLLLTYLFICGVLYLVAFWSIFDLDISNLVSIIDIPKSFVFPFFITQGFFLINILFHFIISSIEKDPEPINNDSIKKVGFISYVQKNPEQVINAPIKKVSLFKRILRAALSLDSFIICTFSLIFFFFFDYKNSITFWTAGGISLGMLLTMKFNRSRYIRKQIPYFTIRHYLGYVLCFFPITCFTTGKILALAIYDNYNIHIIQPLKTTQKENGLDSTQKKLIGFIGNKLIVGSLDNKNIYVLNQSSFDNVVLTKMTATVKKTNVVNSSKTENKPASSTNK